ncbi:protein of unknown function [Desulfocicer vacuolatum DSM 3385]|uniref:DUF3786 domain-containing protein n=1 Tax=Desulfocicer vacuolatum DSM 3385 TaxID=1121400 RepID=A0A1W2B930_9BACT|nr:DUF3786 domain-containing protein [Desulfocicer vacuolatum]SMC69202.1 protein of unknown function [Desulfocicer vacuolatum DSM 3385]
MTDNYAKIVQHNLDKLYDDLPRDLEKKLPGIRDGRRFLFDAFGEACVISPHGITLGGKETPSILGILISLYALNVTSDICLLSPFKAFREIPDSMPYVGAFATHTEQFLVGHVEKIKGRQKSIVHALRGENVPVQSGGDFSFTLFPLPKIALCYVFYEADEDFPASVTCLFSQNANLFLPVDGLADVGEYTSRKILDLALS